MVTDIDAIQFEEEARTPKSGVVDIDWESPADVADLKDYLWENKGYKRRVEEQAIRNIAYVLGDQDYKLNRLKGIMEPDRTRPEWSIRLTNNVILAALLQKLARVQGMDVEWGASPLTDDEPDKAVARMQRDLARHYYTRGFKMPAQLIRAQMLAMETKIACVECNWDPLAGEKKIITPQDFAPFDPMTGQQNMDAGFVAFGSQFGEEALSRGFKTQFTGDMRLNVFPLFELITYPFQELTWEAMFIWMRTRLFHITQAARIAGVSVDEIKPAARVDMDGNDGTPYQDRLASQWGASTFNEMGAARTSRTTPDKADDEMVYVHELWLTPQYDPDRYPDGRTALVIGDKCIESSLKPIPFPNKRPPYWIMQEIPVEGSLYGTCTVDQMRSGQDDLNDIFSQGANYRRRMNNPTIIHFGGWKNGVKQPFNNAPGAVMENTDPQRMPQILVRPDLPSDYERCMNATMRVLDYVAGTGDVDRGQTDLTKAASGKAILGLQAKNDSRVGPWVKTARNTINEVGDFTMECLQEFAVDERITEIIGENHKSEIIIWNREMLRPAHYGQSGMRSAMVRVTGDGGLPTTREDLFNYVRTLTEMGYLQPGRDDEKVFKMVGVGEISSQIDKDRIDSVSETLAIDAFRKGQVPPAPRETSDYRTRLNILGNWINNDDDYLETIQKFPMLQGPINERLEQLKQGFNDREAEKKYLLATADLRMWLKYRARALEAAMQAQSPQMMQMAQAMFAAPLGMQMAGPQEGGDSGGPPQNA